MLTVNTPSDAQAVRNIAFSVLDYKNKISNAIEQNNQTAGNSYFKILIQNLIKMKKVTNKTTLFLNTKDFQAIKEFLHTILNCSYKYLHWLRIKGRDGTFLDSYFSGLDREEPLETICLTLDLVCDFCEKINFDDELRSNLVKILRNKNLSKCHEKIVTILVKISKDLNNEWKRKVIDSIIPLLDFSTANEYSSQFEVFACAIISIISHEDEFSKLKPYFNKYIIPLIKNENFCASHILQPLDGHGCSGNKKSFFKKIFDELSHPKIKKELLFYFLELMTHGSWPLPEIMSIAFANPDRSGFPLAVLSQKEARTIFTNIQTSICNLSINEYVVSRYVRSLFKAQESIKEKLFPKDQAIEKLIIDHLVHCVNKIKNPMVIECAIQKIEKFLKNRTNIFDFIETKDSLLVINSLLSFLKNEELSINAYSLLFSLKQKKLLDCYLTNREISLANYFEYQEKTKVDMENFFQSSKEETSLKENINENFQNKKDVLLESYKKCGRNEKKFFLKKSCKPFLDELLKISNSPSREEAVSECLLSFIFPSFSYKNDTDQIIFDLYLLSAFFTKCTNKKLIQRKISEYLSPIIHVLYKFKIVLNKEIIGILAKFCKHGKCLEASEKVVDFFYSVVILNSNNNLDLVKLILSELKNVLTKSSNFMIKKHILEKAKIYFNQKDFSENFSYENFYESIRFTFSPHQQAQNLYFLAKYTDIVVLYTDAITLYVDASSNHAITIYNDAKTVYGDAINLYLELIQKESSNFMKATLYAELAHCYIELDALDKAQDIFEQAVQLDPNCYKIKFLHAKFLIDFKIEAKEDKVLTLLEDASKINDLYAPIYYYKGLAYKELGEPSATIDMLNVALFIRDEYLEALETLMILHYKTGDFHAARFAHERILKFFPDYRSVNIKKIHDMLSEENPTIKDGNHFYSKPFNEVFDYLKSINDEELSSDTLAELTFKLEKFLPEDIVEDSAVSYNIESFEELHPNEKRRFFQDFLDYVLHNVLCFEYHQSFKIFENKKDRERNIIQLLQESKLSEIFKLSNHKELLESLKSFSRVYSTFEFLKEFLVTNELHDGYALGITDDMASTYDIFPKLLGLTRWEAAYGNFWITDSYNHTDSFFKKVLDTGKPLVFFIPTNIGDVKNQDSITYKEVQWLSDTLQSNKNFLENKNIILVFDAYNYFPFYVLSRKIDAGSTLIDGNKSFEDIKDFLLNYVVNSEHYRKVSTNIKHNISEYEARHRMGEIFYELIRAASYHSKERKEPYRLNILKSTQSVLSSYFDKQTNLEQFYNFIELNIQDGNPEFIENSFIIMQFFCRILLDVDYKALMNPDQESEKLALKIIQKIVEFLKVNFLEKNTRVEFFDLFIELFVHYNSSIDQETFYSFVSMIRRMTDEQKEKLLELISPTKEIIIYFSNSLLTFNSEKYFLDAAFSLFTLLNEGLQLENCFSDSEKLLFSISQYLERSWKNKPDVELGYCCIKLFNVLIKITHSTLDERNAQRIIDLLIKLHDQQYNDMTDEIRKMISDSLAIINTDFIDKYCDFALKELSSDDFYPAFKLILSIHKEINSEKYVNPLSKRLCYDASSATQNYSKEQASLLREILKDHSNIEKNNYEILAKNYIVCILQDKYSDIARKIKAKNSVLTRQYLSDIPAPLLNKIILELKTDPIYKNSQTTIDFLNNTINPETPPLNIAVIPPSSSLLSYKAHQEKYKVVEPAKTAVLELEKEVQSKKINKQKTSEIFQQLTNAGIPKNFINIVKHRINSYSIIVKNVDTKFVVSAKQIFGIFTHIPKSSPVAM